MEVTTQVPETGTKLRIDTDRQFEGQAGDSVLRVQGQSPDGTYTFDGAYVEVDEQEARAIALALRAIESPQPELMDYIAQEVQSTFGSKLSGSDARLIAQVVARGWWKVLKTQIGGPESEAQAKLNQLAERFERAAAKRRQRIGQQSSQAPMTRPQEQQQYAGSGR